MRPLSWDRYLMRSASCPLVLPDFISSLATIRLISRTRGSSANKLVSVLSLLTPTLRLYSYVVVSCSLAVCSSLIFSSSCAILTSRWSTFEDHCTSIFVSSSLRNTSFYDCILSLNHSWLTPLQLPNNRRNLRRRRLLVVYAATRFFLD